MKDKGQRLKAEAKEWGISPTVLAYRAGMSSSNLQKVFNGEAPEPTHQRVQETVDALIREKIQRRQVKSKVAG